MITNKVSKIKLLCLIKKIENQMKNLKMKEGILKSFKINKVGYYKYPVLNSLSFNPMYNKTNMLITILAIP